MPISRRRLLTFALAAGCLRGVRAQSPSSSMHRLHTGDLGALAAVTAQLGDQPWRCLLDTGASVAVVSPRIARELRLAVIARSRVAAAGGVMTVERVALPAVELAGARVPAGEALVIDLAAQLGDAGAGIDGLLGAPSLRGAITRWDFAAGQVQRLDSVPRQGAVWPLRWDQGVPVIDLALGARVPASFLFDTGNAGALLVFARHAAALGGTQALPSVTVRELGGAVTAQHALLERLSAPGCVWREVPVAFEAGGGARRGAHFDRLAGSAGLALFAAGAVTLDGPGGQLVVEQPGLPEPAPLPGGFGFTLGAARSVNAVFDASPAARAGVRPGQRLLALDERDPGSNAEVWHMLHGRAAARFAFDGLSAPVTLARERFFPRWA
jgi:hypothetical protein